MLKSVYIVLYRIKDGRKERLKGKSLHVGVKKRKTKSTQTRGYKI